MRRRSPTRGTRTRPRGFAALAARVSANARKLREARGWTQAEAASRCGLDDRAYRQVESSRANLTLATLARVAIGLNADVVALLETASPLPRRRPGRPPAPLPDVGRAPVSVIRNPPREGPLQPGEAANEPITVTPHPSEGGLSTDASDDQVLARWAALSAALERLDVALRSRGLAPPTPNADMGTRVLHAPVTMPAGRWPVLKDFVVALLAANPRGLLAGEVAEAARSAKLRPRSNEVHAVLHGLVRRRAISRDGRAGSFIYRLRPQATE